MARPREKQPKPSQGALAPALAYRAKGWAVIPVQSGSKRPLVRWERYQQERPSETELRRWLERWPDANLAVVTGAVSGLVVLDVDPKHGGDDSLTALERRHGPLPATLEAITGGGGRHLYFAHPGEVIRNRAGIAPGLDLRGDGGLIVVPPSLHPSGGRYAWRKGHDPDSMAPAPIPAWLIAVIHGETPRLGHPLTYWRDLLRDGVPQGQRNQTIASLTGHLLWHGVDAEVALELLLCWNRVRCRPPLSDDEVVRTVESIERTHRRHTAPGA